MAETSKLNKNGLFYLAGNSLGNAADIPPRSLELLRNADLLIFEEDRQARQCLKAAGIHRPYWRFSEHQEAQTLEEFVSCLKKKQTAVYMSDQGMPNIADPGRILIAKALELGAKISTVPGPCSLTAALAVCPFDTTQFFFAGFLPRDKGERLKALERMQKNREPIAILETPYRLQALLEACETIYGGNRRALIYFQISAPDEELCVDTLQRLRQKAANESGDRNFVMIVEGKK